MTVLPSQIRDYRLKYATKFGCEPSEAPIFEHTVLTAGPYQWHAAPVDVVGPHARPYERGTKFLIQNRNGARTLEELPVEFFGHELRKVDAENEDEVIQFVSEWGIPFSPYRRSFEPLFGYDDTRRIMDILKGMKNCAPNNDEAQRGDYRSGGFVSLEECKLTIRLLQRIVSDLFASVRGDYDVNIPVGILNIGACNTICAHPYFIDDDGDYLGYTYKSLGLTSAVCNQILDTMADDMPWHECPVCGLLFKTQRPRKGRSRRRDIALYCSTTCSDTASKRKSRRR